MPVEFNDVLDQLEQSGTAQNRKVYAKHGVSEPMFGVSFANLKSIAKKIKKDHILSVQLWQTGNHDARILATMIANPDHVTEYIDTWVNDLDNYVITDAFSTMVCKTAVAREKAGQWIQSGHEWIGAAGWNLISQLATKDNSVEPAFFQQFLPLIKETIHSAKNRTRYSINMALIAIGIRDPQFKNAAIRIAQQIGPVEVDHGETSCKTPDAIQYIEKTYARKNK